MCGVVGISSNESVAADIYDALTMLQHRGQNAAGIMTCHRGQFLQRKVRDWCATYSKRRICNSWRVILV